MTTPRTVARLPVAAVLLLNSFAALSAAPQDEGTRGVRIVVPATVSDNAPVSASTPNTGYALLIGSSHYQADQWNDLTGIPGELELVGDALRRQGFSVRTEIDLPSETLVNIVRRFIGEHGTDPNNRLLFYFAGHGESRNNGAQGYYVPIDTPHPQRDLKGFHARAIETSEIIAWARKILSRQALFLFDSCFSGLVLQQRGMGSDPTLITNLESRPVRMFITAGGAGETVPARSDFAPAFAAALNEGLADLNEDGYTTGTELGMYLQTYLSRFGRQTPWYGKINDPALAAGDFVFRSGARDAAPLVDDGPRYARLRIGSTPAGASVFVDGRLLGVTPVTLADVAAGRRQIELRADGFEPRSWSVELAAGDARVLDADLAPVRRSAQLFVRTEPTAAEVTLLGHSSGYRPGIELPEGRYTLRVSADGYQSREVPLEIADQDQQVLVALERKTPPPREPATRTAERPTRRYRDSEPTYMAANTPSAGGAVCYASNSLGVPFYWFGPNRMVAQQAAVQYCAANSPWGTFCQPTGCQ
jgi:hypothetical protein